MYLCSAMISLLIKNEPYGLKHAKTPSKNNREKLKRIVLEFFSNILDGTVNTIDLYDEVNEYGYKRY